MIYDNTFVGNNDWEQDFYAYGGTGTPGAGDGTPDVAQNIFWNDDGVNLPGIGHAVFNNSFRGFGDSLSYCAHSGSNATAECRNIHFYRNDIFESGDDCAEIDYAFRNISMYDNRCTNGMTAASLDNAYGGPFLIARNVFTNIGRSAYKFNGTVSGQFVYNNTLVITDTKDAHGWIQFNNGSVRSWGYRNNIYIYQNAEGLTYWNEATGHDPIDFTHNAWFPDSRFNWNNSGGSGNSLAEVFQNVDATSPVFSGQTQRHYQDTLTIEQPFNQPIVLGASYFSEFTGVPLPQLANGVSSANSGIAIANITDGFSGSAPDRGALISGRTVPNYGDRSSTGSPQPTVNLIATPSAINENETTQLSWSTTDATSCTASGGWSGARATSSSGETSPALTSDTQFTLTCLGLGGTASDSVTVTVIGGVTAPTVTLTASPSTISTGSASTLSWTVMNANSCTASGDTWTGSIAPSTGSDMVTPSMTTEYTLTCTGDGGDGSASATVTVQDTPMPPVVNLSTNATSISNGDSVTLTWAPQNAVFCQASGDWFGRKKESGDSEIVGPLTVNSTFTLTCSNSVGATDEETVSVTVTDPGNDTDSDGLPDDWEITYFGTLGLGPADDPDNDGVINSVELANGTNPSDSDSDNDGLSDGDEITYGTDPLDPDSDNDGHTDGAEVNAGSDPNDNTDTPGGDPIDDDDDSGGGSSSFWILLWLNGLLLIRRKNKLCTHSQRI
ncbi:MAG: hypothetical protein HKM24_02440 [Gammaproteobacteria bacterium]|nr:hypothetical protein [Gammaproteobacteria bacterium]